MPDSNTLEMKPKSNLKLARDSEFANEVHAALMLQTPRGGRLILYSVTLFVFIAIAWSWLSMIDDVVKGQGKVIPSSKVQNVQNLEGGVILAILVDEGDIVQKGDSVVVLDSVQFGAELEKNSLEAAGFEAAMERLKAESNGEEPEFSERLRAQYPDIVKHQQTLYKSRQANLKNQIDVLLYSKREKEQELQQMRKRLESAEEKLELATMELNKIEPMLKSGAVSEIEVLQAKQRVADAKSAMNEAKFAIPGLQSAISEAQERIDQTNSEFREMAERELNDISPKYQGLMAIQKSLLDKVQRTSIESPVRGTVKKIYIDTIGGTVRPGMTMMEIVPLDDRLIVEANIAPKDIGFIRQGQKATVKLSAYDYAIYGGLDGVVENVSADSITDEKGRTYFIIDVSIPQTYMGQPEDNLIIIPGMQAEVDVVIKKRRILDYVLRPLLKAKYD